MAAARLSILANAAGTMALAASIVVALKLRNPLRSTTSLALREDTFGMACDALVLPLAIIAFVAGVLGIALASQRGTSRVGGACGAVLGLLAATSEVWM